MAVPPSSSSRPQGGRLAGQPLAGLLALAVIAGGVALLAVAIGGPSDAVRIAGPLTQFALPVAAVIAFWWHDWPGSAVSRRQAGLVDSGVIVLAAPVLLLAAQGLVGDLTPTAVLDPTDATGNTNTYPWTMLLGVLFFLGVLHLTFVMEGWPVARFGPIAGGVATLGLAFMVAVTLYFGLISWDAVPAEAIAANRVIDPLGPVSAEAAGGWLSMLAVWQGLLFIVLGGWPLTRLRSQPVRLLANNIAVLGLTELSYLVLTNALGMPAQDLAVLGGSVLGGIVVSQLVFGGWPLRTPATDGAGRAAALAITAGASLACFAVLTWAADLLGGWADIAAGQWISFAAFNCLSFVAIVVVLIWRRWPLPLAAGADGLIHIPASEPRTDGAPAPATASSTSRNDSPTHA